MINITSFREPKAPVSEAYRTVRTNIQFSKVDKDVKTIIVTSSKQNEGKTTVICNLAVSFASLDDKKVLIIDGDLRNPTVHRLFNVTNAHGLTDVLTGQKSFDKCVNSTEIKNLHVLTTGKIPPNPSEMLGSNKMKAFVDDLREYYDYIFIDSPPIGIITDAGTVASYADGTILVVGAHEVDVDMAKISKERLEQVDANILGVVLNKYDVSGDYYGYYEYSYEKTDGKRSSKHKKKRK